MQTENQKPNTQNKSDQKTSFIQKFKPTRIKKWIVENSKKPIAEWTLYFISFVDSFISPMPPDPFLALLTVINPKKWIRYAFFTTILGVLGGLIGYFIGFAMFETIGERMIEIYDMHEVVQRVGDSFSNHAFITIFIAAFTPIPYQIATVTAGLFRINIATFLIASIIGRGIRFFIVGAIMYFVGDHFGKLVLKYLNWLLLAFGIAVLLILFRL